MKGKGTSQYDTARTRTRVQNHDATASRRVTEVAPPLVPQEPGPGRAVQQTQPEGHDASRSRLRCQQPGEYPTKCITFKGANVVVQPADRNRRIYSPLLGPATLQGMDTDDNESPTYKITVLVQDVVKGMTY